MRQFMGEHRFAFGFAVKGQEIYRQSNGRAKYTKGDGTAESSGLDDPDAASNAEFPRPRGHPRQQMWIDSARALATEYRQEPSRCQSSRPENCETCKPKEGEE